MATLVGILLLMNITNQTAKYVVTITGVAIETAPSFEDARIQAREAVRTSESDYASARVWKRGALTSQGYIYRCEHGFFRLGSAKVESETREMMFPNAAA